MRVAHIGPPLARQGGPAGYLLQLAQAAERAGSADRICLPPMAATASRPAASQRSPWRRRLSSLRRVISPPKFYRPSEAMLRAERGHVETITSAAKDRQIAEAGASLDRAFAHSADVLFCHDAAVAEHALERRRPGQAVWLMIHAPMPMAFYLAWCWALPEADWREIAALPDVRRWSAWEVGVWSSVDRLIIPCREAFDDLVRIEPTARRLTGKLTYLLSGASSNEGLGGNDRRRFGLPADQRVGLFLGNNQPYRGLDTLLAAAELLDRRGTGVVAVAGPSETSIHTGRLGRAPRRVRALGPVSDVAALFGAVDFVINVNRFSLFDLSTIEALEAGKPLLLHAVGGNLTFQQLGAGCVMLPDLLPSTIAAGVSRMFAMSADERLALGRESRRAYDRHLTLASFWQRHIDLYAGAEVGPIGA